MPHELIPIEMSSNGFDKASRWVLMRDLLYNLDQHSLPYAWRL